MPVEYGTDNGCVQTVSCQISPFLCGGVFRLHPPSFILIDVGMVTNDNSVCIFVSIPCLLCFFPFTVGKFKLGLHIFFCQLFKSVISVFDCRPLYHVVPQNQ